jgi:hypothetical protein
MLCHTGSTGWYRDRSIGPERSGQRRFCTKMIFDARQLARLSRESLKIEA